jgi:amino acid adenylation domain-containing protein
MKEINIFFNHLRRENGAIWIENETIKLSTSEKLQNAETRNFIVSNSSRIVALLKENKVFSKEQFLTKKIFKDTISTQYPLSPAQERLWFIEQYEQGTSAYHVPLVFELAGGTSIEGIQYALQQIVSRHEILRTTIELDKTSLQAVQLVQDEPLLTEEIETTDAAACKLLIKEEISRPFNLSTEYPIRVKLYTTIPQRTLSGHAIRRAFLLINIHHIATDGWSAGIFEKELLAYYEAYVCQDADFDLPPLEIQYKDYAVWQRTFLSGPDVTEQTGYWKTKLSGFEVLEMPLDAVRPARVDYRGSYENFILDKKISHQLRELARKNGTTLHSVLLSSVSMLLGKYTGQDDIVTGSPVANRHHKETEGLIGFFVNMQVNRIRLGHSQRFANLVQKVHQEQVQAQLHQDLPFEKLVEVLGIERDPSRHPIFQVIFAVQDFGYQRNSKKKSIRSLRAENFFPTEKFDLTFLVDDSHEEILFQISYATSLFKKATILRLIDHYIHLMAQLIKSPEKTYAEISLLTPDEFNQTIHVWNKTTKKFPDESTISNLFEVQAAKRSAHTALVYDGSNWTYGQLNEKSNQLARHIRASYKKRTGSQPAPGKIIALFIDRGPELVAAILAVLKAGFAYVPLDTGYPQQRTDFMLEDTAAELILCKRQHSDGYHTKLPLEKCVYVNFEEKYYQKEDIQNLPPYNHAADLAYVLYTSGTSGQPKGVKINHRGVNNLVFAQQEYTGINPQSNVLQYAATVFDASVWEIFSALLHGATLTIPTQEIKTDGRLLCNFMADSAITTALLPPVLLNVLPFTSLPHLKTLLVGGDITPLQTMNKWCRGRKLINAYGPTENTVITSMHVYKAGDKHTNIGKPLANVNMYVLDENNTPAPIGITGNLHIGGTGLATGYLNQDALTEQCFVANPFQTKLAKKGVASCLYKTGDRARWLADGSLEYMGRYDEQVKIRGVRIELAEVEHALSQIPGIHQSCLVAATKKSVQAGDKYLAGYYTLSPGYHTLTQTEITAMLANLLPGYMLPDMLISMKTLPVTINGKLDKKALPDPWLHHSASLYAAPVSDTEKTICAIWEQALGKKRIGIAENFFHTGGNSILAIQVTHLMNQALSTDFKVADLFRLKTIQKIANEQHQHSGLVKPYHTIEDSKRQAVIFIHPGHGGAEVYQQLADSLSAELNCIGIDNYNLYHADKIRELQQLAAHYLAAYEQKFVLSDRIILTGWSLGGLIAMEMAVILEARGHRQIKVILLDTYVTGKINNKTSSKGSVATHAKKATDLTGVEKELATAPISAYLQYTKLVLFRATQTQGQSGASSKKSKKSVNDNISNNISSVAAHLELIDLHCHHFNILETNSDIICDYISSAR